MRLLLSGASGFIGTYLDNFLQSQGHTVQRLVRHAPKSGRDFQWDPERGELSEDGLRGIDVVINLNGASIAGKRWTKAYKQELIDSRVKPTALLAQTMAHMAEPPPLFISMSGAGYYGYHSAASQLSEDAPPAATFISSLARAWEHAAGAAVDAGVWVLHPRLGVVIGNGGMLGKLLPLFRLGLGGRLGRGWQPFSWIALDEIGPALLHCIEHKLEGAVNFTAPQLVTNSHFTRALAGQLHRPAFLTVPASALRIALGEMSEELLQGAHVTPQRLTQSGYAFRFPDIESALAHYVPQLLARR